MNNFFKLKENGTNVKTELMAGLTTFLTMSYILFVNIIILLIEYNNGKKNAIFKMAF